VAPKRDESATEVGRRPHRSSSGKLSWLIARLAALSDRSTGSLDSDVRARGLGAAWGAGGAEG
jgi:hypothetical protein